jgi:hypothetical protein
LKLLVALGIVACLLGAADVVLKEMAEDQIASVAHEQIPDAGPTSADIDSFPFVGRLVWGGFVSSVSVTQHDVVAGPLRVARVEVALDGVHLDRGRLFSDREVFLTRVDAGVVTATITDDEISRLIGVAVRFTPGVAHATLRGVEVEVRAAVRDDALILSPAAGAQLRLPIPRIPLVPCVAEANIRDGVIELSCAIDQIPPELLRGAQRRVDG